MELKESIARILDEHNGVLRASDAKRAGIDYKELQRLSEAGLLERISRGLYISGSVMADEYLVAQHRCGKCIYSHETALYLHGLSDRVPLQLMMTIPSGHNTRMLKDKESFRFFYSKPGLYSVGIDTTLSPCGNALRVYDRERTICDCIKKKDSLDIDLVLSAVKQYMAENESDYAKLLNYADKLKIRDTVKQYMEVLA
ncbi:MAG: type IV toxin-antitoxin system AbiEi family antitoxin domain-containing protein [Coriobacteriia bacterium]|nr:type IV toxin-antitoxin system AbiEi family antitoxin domain-containing protein [Coriobacteriia bacterium]MCL2537287.1 type IV toxin-antitoxin system AbiEi family antitoxin domain-containing protein [Coriobacteriia bacterium]